MIDRVETLTVADAIVEKLLGNISSGAIKWGEKLPSQRELAVLLDVGISSVREALQVLQAMGFVEVRRGDGSYVTERPSVPLTTSLVRSMYRDTSVQELMELREVLDTGLAVLAAKKAGSDSVAEMENHIRDLEAAASNGSGGDHASAVDSDLAFHIALAESVDNPLLAQFSLAVRESYAKFLGEIAHTKKGAALHRKVLETIKSRDPLSARDAMIELLKHTRSIYLKEHFKGES